MRDATADGVQHECAWELANGKHCHHCSVNRDPEDGKTTVSAATGDVGLHEDRTKNMEKPASLRRLLSQDWQRRNRRHEAPVLSAVVAHGRIERLGFLSQPPVAPRDRLRNLPTVDRGVAANAHGCSVRGRAYNCAAVRIRENPPHARVRVAKRRHHARAWLMNRMAYPSAAVP